MGTRDRRQHHPQKQNPSARKHTRSTPQPPAGCSARPKRGRPCPNQSGTSAARRRQIASVGPQRITSEWHGVRCMLPVGSQGACDRLHVVRCMLHLVCCAYAASCLQHRALPQRRTRLVDEERREPVDPFHQLARVVHDRPQPLRLARHLPRPGAPRDARMQQSTATRSVVHSLAGRAAACSWHTTDTAQQPSPIARSLAAVRNARALQALSARARGLPPASNGHGAASHLRRDRAHPAHICAGTEPRQGAHGAQRPSAAAALGWARVRERAEGKGARLTTVTAWQSVGCLWRLVSTTSPGGRNCVASHRCKRVAARPVLGQVCEG